MGVVFQAVDPTIGRTVAIKTIRLGDVINPQERAKLRERLFREARSAGSLSHPNIVTIYDMQEEGDLTYIAMEFVDGPTLDSVMSSGEPISREDVLRILREAASGLDYAHQKRIVHRDIKPANIMLDNNGQVKITDFGIAKVTSSEQFTMTGTIVGTPNYMSPEQVQGLPTVDGRSDQFSLSVIAFEMLTGEKPFVGEHLTTVVYKIVAGDPIPPLRLNPTLGEQIESVLRKALNKQPDSRYLSCIEFVNALEHACTSTQGWTNLARGGSQELPTLAVEQPAVTTATRPTLPPPVKRRLGDTTMSEKRRVSAFTIFLAILVATGLVGMIAWQAAPWLIDSGRSQQAESKSPPKRETSTPTPTPAPAVEKPSPVTPPPPETTPPPKPPESTTPETPAAEAKPEPKPEAEPSKPSPSKSAERRVSAATLPQAVGIVTTPAGALAAIDGRSSASCHTPCTLTVAPGRHFIEVTQPGYQTVHREITVTDGPQDVAPIVLQPYTATLLLSSEPRGATITVNGKPYEKTTPAQLTLPPGTYTITVSKDGKSETRVVQLQNGNMKGLKIDFQAQ